ncbi:FAD-dependent oxidoreductase [Leucobacter celer]|jgi:ferredoxin--NADP+ reductase|uniref:FAD-dependent oxidoreductase n=1 Tax=Leucobacter celer TaxID=668625 RepID=UPI0006A7CF95|nr:FAD-dependent oxidoreductase [Leucobacter celer]
MPTPSSPKIAIVGSGPSGCYLAQSLLRSTPGCELTILDRLVSPFGLVRYGVAADHQHTKAITRQFDRLFQHESVRFAGDIEIGRDLSLDELREHFDAVVLATGLSADRGLGLPGGELPGVIGAGVLTRVLNSHPDEGERLPDLGGDIVVIGAGNVALDVLRFLVKGADDYTESDVADPALEGYLAAPAERVTLVSRSGAADSKGDPQMLRELAQLPRASYTAAGEVEPPSGTELDRAAQGRVTAISEMIAADRPMHPGPAVDLRFGWSPVRVIGTDRVEGVELARGDEQVIVPATAVVTAIGFASTGGDELARLIADLEATPETGRIEAGLYRAGWAQRGPRGAIPENRSYAKLVAEEIAADLADGTLAVVSDRLGFSGLPEAVRERAVGYEQWLALDAHERELAPEGRVRRKLSDHDRMAAIARGARPTER